MERVSGAASRAESEWVCGSGAREFRTFKIFVYIFLIYIDIYEKIAIINFMKRAGQISFDDFRMTTGHGGPRKGAGRPAALRPIVHHVRRPVIPPEGPAHVTLRVQRGVPSLRSKRFVREFRRSLQQVGERDDFRVVLYSIQCDHVHIIVEAAEKDALGRGMKAVSARARGEPGLWSVGGRHGWALSLARSAVTARSPQRDCLCPTQCS